MIQILEKARVICSNRDSLHNYFAWPTVVRLPGGALAMAASGLRLKHVDPFGKGILCYSFNEGKSWTPPAVVLDTPLDDRDCGLAVSGNAVMLTSFNNRISTQLGWLDAETDHAIGTLSPDSDFRYYTRKEADHQRQYLSGYLTLVDAPKAEAAFLGSLYKISRDGGFTFGSTKKAPVSCPHGPAVSPNGEFLYVGNAFNPQPGKPQLECWAMEPGGEFQYRGSIGDVLMEDGSPYLCCEPHAICLPDGRLLVHIRVQNHYAGAHSTPYFALWQAESTDGGRTFTAPHPISQDPQLGAPPHLLLLQDGTLICTCGLRAEPFGIRALISRDLGRTWSKPFLLYDNESISLDLGYPASVELKDGRILTVFYAHPEPGAPAEILQVIWQISKEDA